MWHYALLLVTALGMMTGSSGSKKEVIFYLVGDSTLADKPYAGSNPEKGWGQVLPLYFSPEVRIANHAVNGRSAKSFIAEGRWQAVKDLLKEGDYLLIEFGHNDQKVDSPDRYAEADTEYRDLLRSYIQQTRKAGATPILATPIVRRRFDEAGTLQDTHGRYPSVVREVATEMNVPLLDLHRHSWALLEQFGPEKSKELFLHYRPGDYERFPDGVADDTHLSPTGAFKICDLAVAEIKMRIPALGQYVKD